MHYYQQYKQQTLEVLGETLELLSFNKWTKLNIQADSCGLKKFTNGKIDSDKSRVQEILKVNVKLCIIE